MTVIGKKVLLGAGCTSGAEERFLSSQSHGVARCFRGNLLVMGFFYCPVRAFVLQTSINELPVQRKMPHPIVYVISRP